MTETLPIINKQLLSEPLVQHGHKIIDCKEFFAEVAKVAAHLPDHDYVINYCENRYYFLVGFVAALLRKQITVLPGCLTSRTLDNVKINFPNCYVLSDTKLDNHGIFIFDIHSATSKKPQQINKIPTIDTKQLACIFFTSGSTGAPKPFAKSWGQLTARTKEISQVLGLQEARYNLVATVPVQHLFGFEHVIMLTLLTNAVMHAEKPFFPADLNNILNNAKFSPYLISTPFHLNCFIQSKTEFKPIEKVLSSTAPLAAQLAKQVEGRFYAQLTEIYGCTELGACATRRTAIEKKWHLINGLKLIKDKDEFTILDLQYDNTIFLPDIIEKISEREFILLGRKENNINIVGKRISLTELNSELNKIAGVKEGIIFKPTYSKRLAAVVVAPSLSEQEIKRMLAKRIDAVFLPRPIIMHDSLPRNEVGKILKSKLNEIVLLHGRHKFKFCIDEHHPSLAGHFPNNPIVPGVVILDNIIACYKQVVNHFQLKHIVQVKFQKVLKPNRICRLQFKKHCKGIYFEAFAENDLIISGIFN